jgi:hypothetical protein
MPEPTASNTTGTSAVPFVRMPPFCRYNEPHTTTITRLHYTGPFDNNVL